MVEKRGRKGATDLAVVHLDPNTGRPQPPEDMREREAEIWRTTVDAMARGWFNRETWPMLRAYCKHVDAGERFGERYTALLDEGPPRGGGGVALYWEAVDKLGDRYERETRLMTHLASKLRIAKMQRQSGYKDEVELRNATKKRMWEEDPA